MACNATCTSSSCRCTRHELIMPTYLHTLILLSRGKYVAVLMFSLFLWENLGAAINSAFCIYWLLYTTAVSYQVSYASIFVVLLALCLRELGAVRRSTPSCTRLKTSRGPCTFGARDGLPREQRKERERWDAHQGSKHTCTTAVQGNLHHQRERRSRISSA